MSSKIRNNEFYKIISKVIAPSSSITPLHAPALNHEDVRSVTQTIETGWVSYQGEMVKKFEQELSNYLNAPYVISIVNGTSALFITLKYLGIDLNDEVLLPSLTFAATANAVVHAGGIPHFIDSTEMTLNIDYDKLDKYLEEICFINDKGILINKRTSNPIKALIPVHVLGSSCDIQKIKEISQKFSLRIIEDAAEALGSEYQSQKISALTGVGILSFNANKIITTGGGGAIVTQNEKLAYNIRHLTTTAKKSHRYEFEHDAIGYNLRLPALNAALGFSQLLKLNSFLSKKRELYMRYKDAFRESNLGKIFDPDSFGLSNCWLNAFILDKDEKNQKNNILNFLNDKGIQARPLWKPLHTLAIYKNYPHSDCSVTENLYARVICLPSSTVLVNDA
jgi:perosamine synthetase